MDEEGCIAESCVLNATFILPTPSGGAYPFFLKKKSTPPSSSPFLLVVCVHFCFVFNFNKFQRHLHPPHSLSPPFFGGKKARKLVTPTFERALNGTTVRQVLHLIADTLIKQVTTPYTLHVSLYVSVYASYSLHPT